MATRVDRDLQALIDVALGEGWTLKEASKHWMLYSPDGESIVTVSSTPSDSRAVKNARSRLRKAGLKGA